jgi:hypothetical protein
MRHGEKETSCNRSWYWQGACKQVADNVYVLVYMAVENLR